MNKCKYVLKNEFCNKNANILDQRNDRWFCKEHYIELLNSREKLKKELLQEFKDELIFFIMYNKKLQIPKEIQIKDLFNYYNDLKEKIIRWVKENNG